MKLCRFDLADSPGTARSGIMHGGKVYETDGTAPVAVHEWTDARLLSPIGRAPTVRMFSAARPAFADWIEAESGTAPPAFSYLNPVLMSGPRSVLPEFPLSSEISVKACVGAVVGEAGRGIAPSEADAHVLGLTLALVFFAADLERDELARGLGPTRSHDAGIVVGPALTTPDELDGVATATEFGKRYDLKVALQVAGEDVGSFELAEAPWTLAELVAAASASAAVEPGELILAALGASVAGEWISPGAELRLSTDLLGNLLCRYG